MKTYRRFIDVPMRASYIGSTNGDGSIEEEVADHVDCAWEPVCYVDDDGVKHYFDIGQGA
jgi:hypothetical protein